MAAAIVTMLRGLPFSAVGWGMRGHGHVGGQMVDGSAVTCLPLRATAHAYPAERLQSDQRRRSGAGRCAARASGHQSRAMLEISAPWHKCHGTKELFFGGRWGARNLPQLPQG